jgi:PST family polysaccharide transporter
VNAIAARLALLVRRLAARGGACGALWSCLNAGTAVALPFLIFIFFARVLEPGQIGLVVLAVACAEFVKAIGLPGLYEALLQHQDDRRRYHETALAVLLLAGGALLPVYAAVLALIAGMTGGPGAADPMLLLIGLRIPFDLATLQPQAVLAQRLSYRRMALRSVVANVGAGAAGIGIAAAGAPMIGLIAYQAGQSALLFLATVHRTGALARPRLHRDCLRLLAGQAGMASIVRLVAATNSYVDQILIAALLDTVRLAYFNLAKRVETTFITASASFSAILFQPLFATRQGAAREPVLRNGLATLALVCGVPAVFVAINSTQLVPLVLGPRWRPAAPAVALLALSGLVRALGGVHGALLSVSGRNGVLAMVSTASAIAGIIAVIAAARHGVVWCAAALALKNLAVTSVLAAATWRDAPGLARAYLFDVAVPLVLMTFGAEAGRLLVAAALPAAAPLPVAAGLALSLLLAACGALPCFARRLLRAAPPLLAG